MPNFRFQARDERGEPPDGVLTAPGIDAVTAELRGRGLLVMDVQPAGEGVGGGLSLNPASWLPPASFDVEPGFQQLATMLHSGLRLVADQARRPRAAKVRNALREHIEEGSTFSDALAAHPRMFTPHVVQLMRVGEHAGTLESSLIRSVEHLERGRTLRMMVLNALAYPMVVVLMARGGAAFMILNVVPKIQQFLGGAHKRLPPITQALVDVSNGIMKYLPYYLVGTASAAVALTLIYRWPPGRRFLDGVLLRSPVVGRILRLSGTAVFARG